MIPKPDFYIIDGSAQMYRAYHAIRSLTGPNGEPTNAVYGFVTMLRRLLSQKRPTFAAVAFDLPGPTFRTELAADYKANRPPMPSDLAEQIPLIHQACTALGVPVLTHKGYEADDIIGTLAMQAEAKDLKVAIVTNDKDFFQLVSSNIFVFNLRDGGTWYDEEGVKNKFGVTPDQFVDMLALMGDSSDNVRGVPGIGKRGARALIATHGSLKNLLASVDQVPQKKYREALRAHADDALQSQELVTICTDVPIASDFETLRYQGENRQQCFELFSRLGFRTLLTNYAPTTNAGNKNYQLVRTQSELEILIKELKSSGRFSLCLLCDSSVAMQATIVGLSLTTAPGIAHYLPFTHQISKAHFELSVPQILKVLKPVLEDETILKVGHDLKFDMLVLFRHGITLRGIAADTMLGSYLLDSTRSAHNIEDLSLEQIGHRISTEEEQLGRGARALTFKELTIEKLVDFTGDRSNFTLQLSEHFETDLKNQGLGELYQQIEMPLIPVLADIERVGVLVDAGSLNIQSKRIAKELTTRSEKIFTLAGEKFNINSPKQLSEILFERLKLTPLKRTGKTRVPSTAVTVLEELSLVHELPGQILEWRGLQKLKSTYIDTLPQLINSQTGRVHTSFNQAVTATGRLSSSEPNLQNIPIRTKMGREIRSAFVARPGYLLISADYSQIELRVLAHLSGDKSLIEAFKRGDDIHDQTARKVFGDTNDLDPHELRRRAKIINYALLYGKTAFTLARDIGVTQQAAQEFIDAYFEGFPAVRHFINDIIVHSRDTGVVKTMFGRRRLVPDLSSPNGQIRAAAERATINLPIQGTAADILKCAMIDLHARVASRAPMIMTVHDELLFEVPRADAEATAVLVRERMEQTVQLSVPLTVDVGIGENWKEAKA